MAGRKLKYFANVFLLFVCIFFSNGLMAANLVTADGVALITSADNKSLFRTRAIENALQNLLFQGSQTVDSFSIVENGQILLDQVHLASKLGIQKYDVVEEKIKGKFYHVTLNVVISSKIETEETTQCLRASPPEIDLFANLKVDYNKIPAWVLFSNDYLKKIIINHDFKHKLREPTFKSQSQIKANSLYSLYKSDNSDQIAKNYYKLNVSVSVEPFQNNNMLEENLDLKISVKSHISRKNRKILEKEAVSYFPIVRKSLNGLLSLVSRKNWPSTENDISKFVLDSIDQQLGDLKCLNLNPKIHAQSGNAYLDYGSYDGIQPTDMFLVRNNEAKKIYFRLDSLDDHQTKIKLISKVEDLKGLIGSEVEVVSGS